jgi:hypothetical protein
MLTMKAVRPKPKQQKLSHTLQWTGSARTRPFFWSSVSGRYDRYWLILLQNYFERSGTQY